MSARIYCEPHCARIGPHKTCVVELNAAMAADTRRDTPIVLAKGVIRSCRALDGFGHVTAAKALTEVRRWRSEAAGADDRAVVDAIDLLGQDGAAEVYAATTGRALQLDASERSKLATAAERRRSR